MSPLLDGDWSHGAEGTELNLRYTADVMWKPYKRVTAMLGVRAFASPEVQKETDQELIEITTKGKNKMPGYGSSLKDAQIKDLVAYIHELEKK